MSEKAQAMIDELVAACIEFGRQADPDRLTRLKKARQELHEYIAELEAESDQLTARLCQERQDDKWIPVSERLPKEKQSVLALDRTGTAYHWEYSKRLSNIFVGYYTHWMPLPEPPIVYGKVCIDQLTAHDATERQDDKSPNDTQTQTIVYGKWIPVSERLPEVYRDGDGEFIPFLVCENDKDYPYRAIYDGLNWGDGMFVADVTHWMPLPKPPEVEE